MAAESNDVQAIEKISAVVGESQVKIILSNQCIKAQTLLVNRLKKQFDRQREISKFISSDNLKLEAEIKNAEQEIKSLMLAYESIKSANVELKKEWQLAKERTQENIGRIQLGEKKYEELWEHSKNRYESIGFVRNWLQANRKTKDLTGNIQILENESKELLNEIKIKDGIISELNKKRIIELAEYLIHEQPKTMDKIFRKTVEFKELNDQFDQILNKEDTAYSVNNDTLNCISANPKIKTISSKLSGNKKVDNDWPNFNNNADTLMPKLQLMNIDLDMLSVKLDQIKKCDLIATSPIKEAITGSTSSNDTVMDNKRDEYTSGYFNQPEKYYADETKYDKRENYSKRKLINILDDIKLNKHEAYNLVTNIKLDNLKGIDVITGNGNKIIEGPPEFINEKATDSVPGVQIKEIDITSSSADNILMPPSGFLDQIRSSQEKKKKVSFELPITMQELVTEAKKAVPIDIDGDPNDTLSTANSNSPLEVSAVSDESFTKIKNMILKKHNLDLSPQFVYGKNTVTRKNEESVKSNYFKLSDEELPSISGTYFEKDEAKITEITETNENEVDGDKPTQVNDTEEAENKSDEMEVTEENVPSVKVKQARTNGNPVTGLLFSHGANGIPDSLDVSISTTGLEDEDADFPQYSSLLLSPKVDLPVPTNDKPDITSQEVPNFLSGLRKTGLSFFGKITAPDSANTEGEQSGGNNFNFAFGTDDKKTRGGIFNMFN
ncbi:uncharacterized protein isoform X1 [Choristoneura fumiferana]|uniref:uncharacterized protein isoform X1 n=1 Tax=Choristoneura fumiferana TaxID=7141 RepID=UPI003D1567ED